MSAFDQAIARVASFGSEVRVPDSDLLELYGLFKQARNGDAVESQAPSRFNIKAYAKFSAWREKKGLSREEAEAEYVALTKKLDPSFTPMQPAKPENGAAKAASTDLDANTVQISTGNGVQKEVVKSLENGTSQKELPSLSTTTATKTGPKGTNNRPRGKSLDQNFVLTLKSDSPAPRLSNTLEKILKNTETKTVNRPRARSLDLEPRFLISPFFSEEAVATQVKNLVESATQEPIVSVNTDKPKRILDHLKGVGNMRDLGGLPALTKDGKKGIIKYGVLVRTANLNRATEDDARFVLDQLNIRTIVDLRGADSAFNGVLSVHYETVHDHAIVYDDSRLENNARKRLVLPLISRHIVSAIIKRKASAWRKVQLLIVLVLAKFIGFVRKILATLPIIEVPANNILGPLERFLKDRIVYISKQGFVEGGLQGLYESILLHGHGSLKRALEALAHPNSHPAVFNCAFGKDRTGIIAALLLSIAGTPREVILQDFALSHTYIDTHLGQAEWDDGIKEMPELNNSKEEWGRSPAHYLDGAFKEVEAEYGSIDNYLHKALGFDAEWIAKVRGIIVEPAPESDRE